MKQLSQRLRDGTMSVLDVPLPLLERGMVLVRNHYSLISAGTEGSTVAAARKSLIGKARERPQQVRQVLDVVAQQGPLQAYRAVQKKLEAWSPLGYSSAGVVIEVAPDVQGISVGDQVACAGIGYANHAEVVAVPVNLCVSLPAGADLGRAAYNALGAIAIQGVRQADLHLGETCVVIGLGLLGQLTGLILRASGVRVIGIDINARSIELAREHFADLCFTMDAAGMEAEIGRLTSGIGADAVIITAATDSLEPVNLAGRLLRKRGTVVIVGMVPTGFDRDPDYYRKELSLKMSCSYGPGRYDPAYEQKGLDYPAGLVRWTEKRNMEAFQQLMVSGGLDIGYLTTHRFRLDDSAAAYDLILNKTEAYLGMLIEYDHSRPLPRERVMLAAPPGRASVATPGISFIGAGSYAMSHLLPNLPNDSSVVRRGVATSSGTSARSVAERFGFAFCGADVADVLDDQDTHAVFIATRHDSHARYVLAALAAGKHVFVEKPLTLNPAELDSVASAVAAAGTNLTVGFNRRFSGLVSEIRRLLGTGPMSMIYRVNAGAIPADSWIQDIEIGGGRIVGEACHFIDTMVYLCGSLPERVHAFVMNGSEQLVDTVVINLRFANGAIGSLCYFANGPKRMPKEYIEVYKDGQSAILSDFRELTMYGLRDVKRSKHFSQDKGQAAMVREFVKSVREGSAAPIPFSEIRAVTQATFAALDSLRERTEQPVDQGVRD
ncbi:MAG: bi-domain-containing oxidoreductase [Gammaproteobacteria bacterium]|nr:bi-domain-containing oxidoreductase [Gammaproteobacteria bacterium]